MKRIVFLLVLCFVAGSLLAARPFKVVNVRSTSATYNQVVDSTDTFECDSLYSDTIEITCARFNVIPKFTRARGTGAYDSLDCIVQMYSRYKGYNYNVLLKTDTLGGVAIAADTNVWYIGSDTLLFDQLWFRAIVRDSVKAGANSGASNKKLDTNIITLNYLILPR